jgi:acetyl-CoA carboxylase biotin carboxyl carrier protein
MSESQIQCPVPGTFYRRPSPDADPFVNEGDQVEAGAVVGLIEVMKQFVEITSPASGTLGAFQAEDGEAVAAGQTVAVVA